MEPVVSLRGAVSLLGRFPALAGVDLEVGPGEVVHLRGPNGAGKTTLLRCCAGLVGVERGEARVLGVDLVTDRRAVRPRVGLVGHASGLYEDLTVADNVGFWARAGGAEDGDVAAALAGLGLDGRLAEVTVGRLSAGQRRRASLAAMLARRPELWLLDEPHASLDAEGRDTLDGLVAEAAAVGVSVLIASHELGRSGPLADRAVTIAGGRVVADDPTADDRTADDRTTDELTGDDPVGDDPVGGGVTAGDRTAGEQPADGGDGPASGGDDRTVSGAP